MRGYEVWVHRGGPAPPELHRIAAASDRAASERAEQLFADSPDAIGVEVMQAGERLHVRGTVPVAATPLGESQRPDSDQRSGLWALMQRIERCRHRAELAETRGADGSAAFRAEMAELAQEWRDLALQIETENAASNVGVVQVDEAEAPSSGIVSAAPAARGDGLRRWPGVVVGLVVGALGALTLATPRWIEASTGVDLDRGSGALEWAVTVIALLAVVAAAFFLRPGQGGPEPRRGLGR